MSSSCIATCVFFACCFRAVRPEFGRRPPRHRRVLADAGGPAEAVSSMPTRGDARQRGRPPFTPSRQRVHRVRVSARRRGGDTDEYLGPSRTPSTRQVERRLPRVSRRSPHLELDALLAHEEVDVARRRPRRRPVAARLPRRGWRARRRHRRCRGDATEAPRRLADPVLDALEVRAQARLCCCRLELAVACLSLSDVVATVRRHRADAVEPPRRRRDVEDIKEQHCQERVPRVSEAPSRAGCSRRPAAIP